MILAASQQPMPDVAISTEPTRQETTVPKTCMLSMHISGSARAFPFSTQILPEGENRDE